MLIEPLITLIVSVFVVPLATLPYTMDVFKFVNVGNGETAISGTRVIPAFEDI